MADIKVRFGARTLDIPGGDLKRFADPANPSILFDLAQSEIVQFNNGPLAETPSDRNSLSAALTVSQDAKWSLGTKGNVTFGFAAGVEGSLTIQKTGELLRYRLREDEEEEAVLSVPPGFAFIILN